MTKNACSIHIYQTNHVTNSSAERNYRPQDQWYSTYWTVFHHMKSYVFLSQTCASLIVMFNSPVEKTFRTQIIVDSRPLNLMQIQVGWWSNIYLAGWEHEREPFSRDQQPVNVRNEFLFTPPGLYLRECSIEDFVPLSMANLLHFKIKKDVGPAAQRKTSNQYLCHMSVWKSICQTLPSFWHSKNNANSFHQACVRWCCC